MAFATILSKMSQSNLNSNCEKNKKRKELTLETSCIYIIVKVFHLMYKQSNQKWLLNKYNKYGGKRK